MACNNGKTDPVLGGDIHKLLLELGLETRTANAPDKKQAFDSLRAGVFGFLKWMSLDITDASLENTPSRVAEMFTDDLCYGLDYANFPKCTTTPNGQVIEDMDGGRTYGRVDEMVMVDSILTVSLCEHHFQSIHGLTHVAYIPGPKLLGLSKFARVVNFFARRPQVQERMTEQIYAALSYILETPDVAVQAVATHNCMRARGVMDPHSKTTTSKLGGRFMSVPALRSEFLNAIPRSNV